MHPTDDTIVAIATPAGHGGVGVVRLSGARAAAIGLTMAGRATAWTPRVATRERLDWRRPSGRGARHVLSWAEVVYRRRRRGVLGPWQPGGAGRSGAARRGARRPACARRRVHPAGVPERQARSGAGRSGARSGRGGVAGAGPRGVRSARRHVVVGAAGDGGRDARARAQARSVDGFSRRGLSLHRAATRWARRCRDCARGSRAWSTAAPADSSCARARAS